jgi:ubiquinone/menaquinone biosynthesis C-methylase UbiE
MAFYTDRILPRFVHLTLGSRRFRQLREETVRGLSGTVLEVGFGSGLNLPYYSREVSRLLAIEPAQGAWHLARKAIAAASFPVEHVGDTAEDIPLPGGSVDTVVSTWTLCTIPDAPRALREIRRVLKPEGTFHFLEHGHSPEPRVARWQDRLTPLQKLLAGGCHLNRPIDRMIEEAGFRFEAIDRFYGPGPKVVMYFYAGAAGR